jgi:hypothetical protein
MTQKRGAERFMIQWGSRSRDYALTRRLDTFYRGKSRRNLSAAIVIDLYRMADHLVTAADRPLVTIRAAD